MLLAVLQALHDALLEVVAVFEGVASYGMIRSLINAGGWVGGWDGGWVGGWVGGCSV
jgi:hypothetical protein